MGTQKVLLLEDTARGRKGEIVDVKSGFARNWLLPRGKALRATKHAIRMQERLQEERSKQAALDKADAEKKAEGLQDTVLEFSVKMDQNGHMYGSVSSVDVHRRLVEMGNELDRRQVVLPQPIKKAGTTDVLVRLNEGVTCTVSVKVIGEGIVVGEVAPEGEAEATAEGEEAPAEEGAEEAAQE